MTLQQAAKTLLDSDYILISLGNGFNIDGGHPDFTPTNSGYFKDAKDQEEIPGGKWYVEDPSYDMGFFAYRMKLYNKTEPNPGYGFLKKLVQHKNYFVTTSCIEGYASKFFSQDKIYEVHGSIRYWHCTDMECPQDMIHMENLDNVEYDEETYKAKALLTCPTCKNYLRPNIAISGDWNFNQSRTQKQSNNFNDWLAEIKKQKDPKVAILEIGAGEFFPTIRDTDHLIAEICNGTLIRINLLNADIPESKFPSFSFKISAKDAINVFEKEISEELKKFEEKNEKEEPKEK